MRRNLKIIETMLLSMITGVVTNKRYAMNDDTALIDIESIKQLKARYCRYLDTKDWDRWRDLFTDDFVGDTTKREAQ